MLKQVVLPVPKQPHGTNEYTLLELSEFRVFHNNSPLKRPLHAYWKKRTRILSVIGVENKWEWKAHTMLTRWAYEEEYLFG